MGGGRTKPEEVDDAEKDSEARPIAASLAGTVAVAVSRTSFAICFNGIFVSCAEHAKLLIAITHPSNNPRTVFMISSSRIRSAPRGVIG
jgi:hypothetical protein